MFISAINTYSYKQNYPVAKKNNEILNNGNHYSSKSFNCNLNFGINYGNLHQIKANFAKEGVNYLMPNEIWSDSKIEKAINKLDKNVKNLIKANNLTKKTLNDEINAILPQEKKNSIKVFDTSEIKDYYINAGIPKEQAEEIAKNHSGMQVYENNISKIFIPLKSFLANKKDRFEQLNLRMTLAHELTHSLQEKFQNNGNHDQYHNKRLGISQKYREEFFNFFEEIFYPKFLNLSVYTEEKNPCEKNFYKYIKVKNEKELFKDFDKAFDKVLDTKLQYYSRDRHNTKQFFTFCKNRAHDEKMAYKTTNIMSELYHDKKCFINYDYRSLLYEKMEKYFNLKEKSAKEAEECTREYKFKNLYG